MLQRIRYVVTCRRGENHAAFRRSEAEVIRFTSARRGLYMSQWQRSVAVTKRRDGGILSTCFLFSM